jgi:hypothetical protein
MNVPVSAGREKPAMGKTEVLRLLLSVVKNEATTDAPMVS